jgi:hypothetical protein
VKSPELDFYERLQASGAAKPTAPSEGSAVEKEMKRVDQDFSTPVTLRNLFTHHDTHPVVLDLALMKAFGLEWLGWEAVTIWAEVKRVFKTELSEHTRAKIQAIRALHTSEAPWMAWHVFEKVIQALNNNIPRFDVVQAPSLEQLYAGVDIMDTVRHENFSDEVKHYIAAAVLHEDVFYVPPPLDVVQSEVAHPVYVCEDCGTHHDALFNDATCDFCTKKFSPENGLSFRPDAEVLNKGLGKRLRLELKYNPDEIQKRWLEVSTLASEKVELDDHKMADVQVAKLLVARDYLNIRRRQLSEQLVSLKSWLGAT